MLESRFNSGRITWVVGVFLVAVLVAITYSAFWGSETSPVEVVVSESTEAERALDRSEHAIELDTLTTVAQAESDLTEMGAQEHAYEKTEEISENPDELSTLHEQQINRLPLTKLQKQKLLAWERARGYHITKFWVPAESRFQEDVIEHLHLKLSVEELEILAANGDSTAQLYYALNIREEEPQKAVDYFLETAIHEGYSSAYNLIATTYYNQVALSQFGAPGAPKLSTAEKTELLTKAGIWAMVGIEQNDIYSADVLRLLKDENWSEQQVAEMREEALRIKHEHHLLRFSRDRGEFPQDALAADIVEVVAIPK